MPKVLVIDAFNHSNRRQLGDAFYVVSGLAESVEVFSHGRHPMPSTSPTCRPITPLDAESAESTVVPTVSATISTSSLATAFKCYFSCFNHRQPRAG